MMRDHVLAAARQLCNSLGTQHSLLVARLLEQGEHEKVARLSLDPHDYRDLPVSSFRDDWLVTEYLSKYKGLVTGIDTERVALDSFAAAEKQCAEANSRLRDTDALLQSPWLRVILRAQRKIQCCIGTHPKWSKLLTGFRWGQGATSTLKSMDARLDTKLREEHISVTLQALPYLRAAMGVDLPWLRARGVVADGPVSLLRGDFQIVPGSRGMTVDKNAKTDRFIAAEPTGNMFLQLGVGGYIRRCLRRVGIDLDDQTINQGLARDALDLRLATVDLKAASDTICRELVWTLLPIEWAIALDKLRSHYLTLDDGETWLPLEKFSSMGNGFTFELESLIFWALTESLCEEQGHSVEYVSVYGDDIICPSAVVPALIELFAYVGFEVNTKKTHWTSEFRESCGKHYFRGQDVTPIYQKTKPTDEAECYTFANRLLYHAIDRGWFVGGHKALADRKLLKAYRCATKAVHELVDKPRLVPVLTRDRDLAGGLAVRDATLYNAVRVRVRSDGWIGVKALTFKPKRIRADGQALLAWILREADSHVREDTLYADDVVTQAYRFGMTVHECRKTPRNMSWLLSFGKLAAKRPGPEARLPSQGMLTLRGRGRWAVKTAWFPES